VLIFHENGFLSLSKTHVAFSKGKVVSAIQYIQVDLHKI